MRNEEYGGYSQRGPSVPVQVGDELDVTIEAVGAKGDGIAKKNGFVLFVPGVKEGERIRIKVTKVLRKVGFAEKVGSAGSAPSKKESQEDEYSEEAPAAEAATEDSENFGDE